VRYSRSFVCGQSRPTVTYGCRGRFLQSDVDAAAGVLELFQAVLLHEREQALDLR
jgi:hypothetical protein